MSESLGEAVLELTTDDSKLDSGMRSARSKAENLAVDFGKIGLTLTGIFTAPIAAVAKFGIEFDALKEQASIAFTTMLGDGQKAQAFLLELQNFAATTPFEFPGLMKASQKIVAMGFESQQVIPMLTAIGDAASGMGRGQEGIDRITNAILQMKAKNKVSAEEMTQQLGEIIPAWEFLAAKIGVDVPTAMDMAQKGMIDVDTAISGLLEGMTGKFGGMMEAQSKTFNGLVSTIMDSARFIIGEALTPLFTMIRDGLQQFVVFLPAIQSWFASLSPEVLQAGIAFAAVLAAAGPLALIIAGISAAVAALLSPVGLAIAALGGLAVGLAVFPDFRDAVVDTFKSIVGGIQEFIQENSEAKTELIQAWQAIKAGIGTVLESLMDLFQTVSKSALEIWEVWGDDITFLLKGAWSGIATNTRTTFEIITGVIKGGLEMIKGIIEIFTGIVTLNWGTFSKGIKDAWGGAWDSISALLRPQAEAIKIAVGALVTGVSTLWNGFTSGIKALWQGLWDAIVTIVTAPINAVKNIVGGFTEGVTGYFRSMYESVVGHSFVPDMMTGIDREFKRLPSIMVNPTQSATGGVLSSFSNMFNSVLSGARDWQSGLEGILGSITKKFLDNPLGDMLSGIPGAGGLISKGLDFAVQGIEALIGKIGQGRETANEFVGKFQNPFGEAIASIHNDFLTKFGTGQLTPDQGMNYVSQVGSLWAKFQQNANQFGSQGETEATVVQQAFQTLSFIPMLIEDMMRVVVSMRPTTASGATILDPQGQAEIQRYINQQTGIPGLSGGLRDVGPDPMIAMLHPREAVLTADEADDWRGGKSRGGVNVNITVEAATDPEGLRDTMIRKVVPMIRNVISGNIGGLGDDLLPGGFPVLRGWATQ